MLESLLAPLSSIGSSMASGLGSLGSSAASAAGKGLSFLGKSSGILSSSGSFDWNGLANAALRSANGAGQGFLQGYTGKNAHYTSGIPNLQTPLNFNFNFKNPFTD